MSQWLLEMRWGRAYLCLAHWPERTEEPAEAWGPQAGLGQQIPHPGQLPWPLKVVLTSQPTTCLLWSMEVHAGAGMVSLRADLTLGSPFRGEGGVTLELQRDRREMGAHKGSWFSEAWREQLGGGEFKGVLKAISEVPPGPLTHSRPRCADSLERRAAISF